VCHAFIILALPQKELEDLQDKNGHFCDFARFRLHCIQKISCLLPGKKRKTFPFYNKNVLAKTVFFCYTLANEYSCNREDVMEKNVLNTDLTGKVAVVTGASGTLCSIFAKALARAGAKVALLGRNMDKLKELADEIEAEDGTPTERTKKILAATPMGHFGDSEKDLVGALLFLLNNEAAGFITGICLPVDGGFSAYSGV
jgi:hypothetical protein